MMIKSFIGLPSFAISLTKMPLWKVQCSRKSLYGATLFWSRMSISGSAYLDKDAVKITTSKYFAISFKKSMQPGLTKMYT